MNRRDALKTAMWGGAFIMIGFGRALAKESYPVQVDENLWQGINRVKNSAGETTLEKLHAPVIKAPDTVRAGEPFAVEVSIGSIPHPMGPSHWIEHLQLNIGNEPASNIIFQPHGYVRADGTFQTMLGDELKGKTVSLIAQIKCNLHGIWQNYVNVKIL